MDDSPRSSNTNKISMITKKTWVIGYFTNEDENTVDSIQNHSNYTNNDYSVVPSIWLTYNDGNYMCKWPTKKSTNISNLVKMYKDITKDFSYHLFYLANNIFYDSFGDATNKLQHILNSSDSESNNVDRLGRGKRKKISSSSVRSLFETGIDADESSDDDSLAVGYTIENIGTQEMKKTPSRSLTTLNGHHYTSNNSSITDNNLPIGIEENLFKRPYDSSLSNCPTTYVNMDNNNLTVTTVTPAILPVLRGRHSRKKSTEKHAFVLPIVLRPR